MIGGGKTRISFKARSLSNIGAGIEKSDSNSNRAYTDEVTQIIGYNQVGITYRGCEL